MELLAWAWDLAVHLDAHLAAFVQQHGAWTYGLLFLIVFCETGLVVTPFLPGDALLMAAGALAANPAFGLNVYLLVLLLMGAAILGNTTNYFIGRWLGKRVFQTDDSLFFRKRYLTKAHEFYER